MATAQKYQVTKTYDKKVRLANLQSFGVDISSPRSVQIVTITPQMASIMVTHNIRNREVSGQTVQKYKGVMLKGNWNFEGYISFDASGAISNGQHRLWAIIESGMTFDFVVVYGMEIHADTDTGRQRSAFDNFCLMNNLPPVITNRKCVGVVKAMLRRKNKGRRGASNSEVEDAIMQWQNYLIDMAPVINMKAGSVWFNVALMSAYMNGVDFNDIQTFKNIYITMGSRGKVPSVELPIKALHDTIFSLPSGGSDQNMNFILTATQNALYEYINQTCSNCCISSKNPIWEYDCTFMNHSKLTHTNVTAMYY